MISPFAFHTMLIPILGGMLMLAVGFNFRERNAGVLLLWVGMLFILGTVVYKILAQLSD
ncbi:hypothetical protein [Pseudomonas batumici]|uniref:Uncharacterized protein n=1 Tax=Pseudomonas batumici TaxID=226910 RepID=A0A0C2I5D3_9PSED|nr:hypothetical protein [Pseudomonas batumici]KIH84426.1 hypothetical protein UCMB321_1657 [Pseudomonas batumici]